MSDSKLADHSDQIAIVGMAGRFPGARDLNQYWENLRAGVESISFFTDEELLAAGVDPRFLNDPAYVKAAGVLDEIDQFDATFFGFNPREAEITDPQQRVFLECAWEAMEDAGYDSESYNGAVGVFAGVGMNTYWLNLFANSDLIDIVGGTQAVISNDKDYLSTLVSYKLNLRGPSLTVQTACSTSLVAVHLACQSLLNGECDMALAGGSKINVRQIEGYHYQEGGIASPDGHCRAFDAQARGCMGGSGVGIVVLKRLADALTDGDLIHAVIKGSAINNDGSAKVGFTAPSVRGQAEVISEALAVAQVQPETITYVEAHGTGTSLGDPIEIRALTQAFRAGTQKKGYCAIGSVKTNIGHLDAAAGVASLIKTVLALKHRQLPPSLNFTEPNPLLDLDNSPFFVNTKLVDWNSNGSPLRAGVSSFGIGGTNAHVILQEAPPGKRSLTSRRSHLLLFSARTASALELTTDRLRAHLQQHPQLTLADVARTLQLGRRHFAHRRLLRCSSIDEAVQLLGSHKPPVITSYCEMQHRPVAFMFAGQGTQRVNMCRQLYQQEPLFSQQIDRCAEMLKPHLGLDLREVLYPQPADEAVAELQLRQTKLAQPALFVIEYALAQMLISYGVKPEAMIGHSLGEYVAACLGGVFSLKAGLGLVVQRARMMQKLEGGAMTAVALGESALGAILPGGVSIAADNGGQQCVISGREESVAAVERELESKGVGYKRLETSHAFHSVMMEPMLEQYEQCAREVEKKSPKIAIVSSVSGQWMNAEEAIDAGYWRRQVRERVRFREGLQELVKQEGLVLVEIGVGEELSRLARRQARGHEVVAILGGGDLKGEVEAVEDAVGRLWKSGVVVKWDKNYEGEQRQRVELPTYPFERERYWLDEQRSAERGQSHHEPELNRQPNLTDWFYAPIWKQSKWPLLSNREAVDLEHSTQLIFIDESRLCSTLVERLQQDGRRVISVKQGETFAELARACTLSTRVIRRTIRP